MPRRGPLYSREEADRLAADRGWAMKPDGDHVRRVVPSPRPQRIFELGPIRHLLERGVTVICAGGGGIPTMYAPDQERYLTGIEAVIDKDHASALLARDLSADLLVLATDADGVHLGHGTSDAQVIGRATPDRLAELSLPAGSMGPKVEAACDHVTATGTRAVIGALDELAGLVDGVAGTSVVPGTGLLERAGAR